MFPFGRGLCHAYWAPNFWVFYIISDKGLDILLRKLGLNVQAPAASFTGGLVGDSLPFAVLPKVLLICSTCCFSFFGHSYISPSPTAAAVFKMVLIDFEQYDLLMRERHLCSHL
ncbi:hypothetical protein P3X46_014550 [Hevea brasiliensis]|uniref:Alpha-1,3-glucosyltransferase n=1 Tax=Hevea brasiliensis TaxID=3981 RepID=A0ABQ9LUZ7_HEVBR|nr:hypothetical protein P3X46_014550 [Hevea brasiliensis]